MRPASAARRKSSAARSPTAYPSIRLDPRTRAACRFRGRKPATCRRPTPMHNPRHAFRSADEATVALVIQEILALPDEARFRCRNICRRKNAAGIFFLGIRCCCGCSAPPAAADRSSPSRAARRNQKQWEDYFSILPKDRTQRPAIETILLPAFSAADHLAVFYSLVYRSSYVFQLPVRRHLGRAGSDAGSSFTIRTRRPGLVAAEFVIIFASSQLGTTATSCNGIGAGCNTAGWRNVCATCASSRRSAPKARSIVRAAALDAEGLDWVNWYALVAAPSASPARPRRRSRLISPQCATPCARRKSPARPPTMPPMRAEWRSSTTAFITPARPCSARRLALCVGLRDRVGYRLPADTGYLASCLRFLAHSLF